MYVGCRIRLCERPNVDHNNLLWERLCRSHPNSDKGANPMTDLLQQDPLKPELTVHLQPHSAIILDRKSMYYG
ncbi:hypothetical protein PRECH8_28130 [Insulibacter thermoxylanivorax]|uniref:Uncharacterized protein n=1 Tax=Insulibacter thermoxylanivorax TaxID=2749268 RepID=A0A916VGK5_9BACL|nr:hypothetical protein PRECH8_28130 [Insulibacter thermoxylanivorax]